MGLTVRNDSRGLEQIGHDGGGFGFSSQAWWHPDAQLAVVILTNSEPDNTTAIVEALSAALLPPGPAPATFAGDPSPMIGNSGPATEIRFDTGGDHLILKRQ
jgi:hypothetical protein